MKTPKTIQPILNLQFRQEKTNEKKVTDELVNHRFEIKPFGIFRSRKPSSSLVVQMYSQDNEILFI